MHNRDRQLIAQILGCSGHTVRTAEEEVDNSAQLAEELTKASTFRAALGIVLRSKLGTRVRIDAVDKALELASAETEYAELFAAIGRESAQRGQLIRKLIERRFT